MVKRSLTNAATSSIHWTIDRLTCSCRERDHGDHRLRRVSERFSCLSVREQSDVLVSISISSFSHLAINFDKRPFRSICSKIVWNRCFACAMLWWTTGKSLFKTSSRISLRSTWIDRIVSSRKFCKSLFDVRDVFASDEVVSKSLGKFSNYLREIQSLFAVNQHGWALLPRTILSLSFVEFVGTNYTDDSSNVDTHVERRYSQGQRSRQSLRTVEYGLRYW